MRTTVFLSSLWLASRFSVTAATAVVSLTAIHDSSVYSGSGQNNSNGGGITFVAGTNNNGPEYRRGLVAFDLSAIPSNATILSAFVKFTLAKAPTGESDRIVSLHRASASWGENKASDSGSGSGSGNGVPAMLGDVTWLTRFFDQGPAWTKPGGDFSPTPSASTSVSTDLTDFTWSGPGLIVDVQTWVAAEATNFGWFVLGDEFTGRTNRQFFTHESTTPGTAPTLTVTYSVPEPHGAMFLLVGGLVVLAIGVCARRRLRPRGAG